MSAVRSITLTERSTDFSRLDCWEGVSSSSMMITSISSACARSDISWTLPLPTNVAGLGDLKRCVTVAMTSAPAVCARRSSSSKDVDISTLVSGRSTPTKSARSRGSSVSMSGNRSLRFALLRKSASFSMARSSSMWGHTSIVPVNDSSAGPVMKTEPVPSHSMCRSPPRRCTVPRS